MDQLRQLAAHPAVIIVLAAYALYRGIDSDGGGQVIYFIVAGVLLLALPAELARRRSR